MEDKFESEIKAGSGKAGKEMKVSIADVSVALGLQDSLTSYGYLFTELEAKLINYFAEAGKQTLTGLAQGLMIGLSYAPGFVGNAFFNNFVVHGYKELMAIRNRLLQTTIDKAIGDGFEQIVILPGAYEIHAYTTALSHAGITVFELNRSPTYDFKIEAVKRMSQELKLDEPHISESPGMLIINDNLHYGKYEPDEDLFETLSALGLNKEKPTYFLLPRYTMYLEPEQNLALLKSLQQNTNDKDRVLISYAEKMPTHSSLVSFFTSNQPYQCVLPTERSVQFLNEKGFRVSDTLNIYSPLDSLGATDIADYHRNNVNKPTEQFYTIYQQEDLSDQVNFENLSTMELFFPEKPPEEEEVYSCNMM